MNPKTRVDMSALPVYIPGASAAKGSNAVIKLSSNESALGPSPAAVSAYKDALLNIHRYPDPSCRNLCHALAEHHNIDADKIVCGAGAEGLMRKIVACYLGVDDEVIMNQHAFSLCRIAAASQGAVSIQVPEQNLTADLDAMLAAIGPRTRMIYLANPNNPTGTIIGRQKLRDFVAKIPSDILLILDSAYAEFVTDPDYMDGLEFVNEGIENVIVLRTFSKLYGLAGLRVGWCYGCDEIVNSLRRVVDVFGVSVPAQAAATAGLKDREHARRALEQVLEWRSEFETRFADLGFGVTPSHGNFVLIHCDELPISSAQCHSQLSDRGIILRPVADYGLPESLRVSVGKAEENKQLFAELETILS